MDFYLRTLLGQLKSSHLVDEHVFRHLPHLGRGDREVLVLLHLVPWSGQVHIIKYETSIMCLTCKGIQASQ